MSEHHSSDRRWPRMSCRILAPTALLLLVAIASFSVAQQPGNIGPAPGQQVTLRQQLTVGLKAFTKADFAFIDLVVLAVEQRKLPRLLVDSTFLWARQKAASKSYTRSLRPMVYFRPGLILRAKRLGVKL